MDPKLTRDTAARVVAWHNRHPLARRIRPEQVGGVGVVGLPFTPRAAEPQADVATAASDAPAASAGRLAGWRRRLSGLWPRLRRAEPAAASPWQATFDEPFLPGFELTATQRWAEAHAVDERPGSEEAPQRLVPPREALLAQDLAAGIEAALGESAAGGDAAAAPPWTQRWLLSAAIDSGGARHRLLLAPDAPKAVLGRRALAPGRIAAATGLLAGLLTLAALAPWLGAHGAAGSTAHAASAASSAGSAPTPAGHASAAAAAASAPSDASPHADTTHAPAAEAKASEAAGHGETAHGAAAASSPQAPHGGGPDGESGHAPAHAPAHPPAVAPDPAHAGGHTPAAPPAPDRHGSPHDAPAPATPRVPAGARGDRPGAATPPATLPAKGPVFALATRPSPIRAEAEALRRRMEAAAATLAEALPGTQVELLQRGERWSAVWWPFASRDAATQARWALALKGVTVEVVEF